MNLTLIKTCLNNSVELDFWRFSYGLKMQEMFVYWLMCHGLLFMTVVLITVYLFVLFSFKQ